MRCPGCWRRSGSGVGAIVIVGGAVYSAVRFARDRSCPGHARLAGANVLIALGTLVLSSGGLVQGAVGHDEAFAAHPRDRDHRHLLRVPPGCHRGGRGAGRSNQHRVKSHPEWSFGSSLIGAPPIWLARASPGGSSNGSGTRVRAA